MKKLLLLLCCMQFAINSFSQEVDKDSVVIPQGVLKDSIIVVKDSTKYIKSIEYAEKREFTDNLKSKYADKDFIYTEEAVKEKEDSPPMDLGFLKSIANFLKVIFPFLLGGFIIFIILKIALGSEMGFWNFTKGTKKTTKKLIYEDDNIHEVDLETLLQQAISEGNYRLAIRYYYLSILKELSVHKIIAYHKEKTNTEYTFEIENENLRNDFKYLSYVYTYVWYGEFDVDKANFENVQKKYQSFKNKVHK
ncbi:hypothetical protein [Polaribacter aestuariivivens]|uniref:hypothetical protein n=1 Tax=Polaribacter aestuariivivens TaxID=2304626 RepID=UPI003F4943E8